MMSIAWGLKIGNSVTYIGSPKILQTFLLTIHRELETQGWGSRFPLLLNDLYVSGKIAGDKGKLLKNEMDVVRSEFASSSPDDVIWILNKEIVPAGIFNSNASDLTEYFVTQADVNLIDILIRRSDRMIKEQKDIEITEVPAPNLDGKVEYHLGTKSKEQ